MVGMRGCELERDLMNDVTLNHEVEIKKKIVSRLLTPTMFQLWYRCTFHPLSAN